MRNTRGSLVLLSSLIWLIAWAGVAAADTTGAVGTVAGLQINTMSADTYLQYHGRVFVKNADGNLDVYHWGGTSCGTRVLTEAQVAVLQQALDNRRMRIEPLHQTGQGNILCLVGVTVVPKLLQNSVLAIP